MSDIGFEYDIHRHTIEHDVRPRYCGPCHLSQLADEKRHCEASQFCLLAQLKAADELLRAAKLIDADMDVNERTVNAAQQGFVGNRAMRMERLELFIGLKKGIAAYEAARNGAADGR